MAENPGPFSIEDVSVEDAERIICEAGGGLVERIICARSWELVITFKGERGEKGRPVPVEERAGLLRHAVTRAVEIVKLRVEKA